MCFIVSCGFYFSTHVSEISEGDELHDVPHGLFSCVGPQDAGVSIQELHGSKVCVADTDDDDGHGKLGRLHNGVTCLVHIADDAVCYDEESEVLLQRRREEMMRG